MPKVAQRDPSRGKTSLWVLWFQAQSPSCRIMCHPTAVLERAYHCSLRASAWEFGEKRILDDPGSFVWVAKVGAGSSGGGDSCPSLQPSEASMAWFLVPGGGGYLPKARGCGHVWRRLVGERGGQGSKLLLPPGLRWARSWAVLGLSLHRKWGFLLCWGLGLCQDKGEPGPWGGERNQSQI